MYLQHIKLITDYMRNKIACAIVFIVLAASCGKDNVVVSGDARLSFTDGMAYSLSFGGIRDMIFNDRLITDNGDFGSFRLRNSSCESTSRGRLVRMEGMSESKLTGGGDF